MTAAALVDLLPLPTLPARVARGAECEDPVRARIDAVARDVGRLRRRIEGDGAAPSTSSLAHLADRLSDHVESLDCMTHECAHELYVDFLVECGDEDVAVEEALRVVDARVRTLRGLLGLKAEK